MKIIFLIPVLFFITAVVNAADCPGYIIKTTGDTVRGTVDVPVNKALLDRKGIDFGGMWSEIKFSQPDGKPQKMKAGVIAGYGFTYLGQWYHLEVLDLQKNSGQDAPKFLGKKLNDFRFFILRLEDGPLPLYREYWNSENNYKDINTGRERITGYNSNEELYAKTAEYGYVEIAPTTLNGFKKLKDFLKKYLKLEEEFLNSVDDKAKFSDAEETLRRYNAWKKTNK